MRQIDQLPPNPSSQATSGSRPPAGSTLPPLDSDMLELEEMSGRRRAGPRLGWSPTMTVVAIFVGSFIAGVLFTSGILAGIIEIQPAVIKGFIKTILGKN